MREQMKERSREGRHEFPPSDRRDFFALSQLWKRRRFQTVHLEPFEKLAEFETCPESSRLSPSYLLREEGTGGRAAIETASALHVTEWASTSWFGKRGRGSAGRKRDLDGREMIRRRSARARRPEVAPQKIYILDRRSVELKEYSV